MISSEQIKKFDQMCIMQTYARFEPVFVRGDGVRLWDAEGKEYLDFLSGIAVNSLGHCHPRLVSAISEQAATLIHASNLCATAPQALLAKKLMDISDFDRVFFCNSGAEANEAAIKIARKHGKKAGKEDRFTIITAKGSFHGRTMATVTATAQEKYQKPFAPMLPGFEYVPFNDVAVLTAAMNDSVCAVMLEPVQGEGGVYPAVKEYLQAARKLCDQFGALLMFDEIQTGVGRTGDWFAYKHYGVVPDVMTLAKGLGGGLPIGACLARGDAATTLVAGDHGSTFAGNPVAASAANAVLATIEEEKLCANAKAMGDYFVKRIKEEIGSHVAEVRGLGLMLGIELKEPKAKQVVADALKAGLIINAIGEKILRILPPLIVNEGDIDRCVKTLKSVL